MANEKVVVVMGSQNDLYVMGQATSLLSDWGVGVETQIVSAHRTPRLLQESVEDWESRGVQVIIAGAGGAAHLPGMLASLSLLPVIGVPIKLKGGLGGLDALLSIAQMPKGVPVASMAIDNATNAALMALEILSLQDNPMGKRLKNKMRTFKKEMRQNIETQRKHLKVKGFKSFLKTL